MAPALVTMPDEADYRPRPRSESPFETAFVAESPLGEPLDQASATELNQTPLAWHLRYWLSLGFVGILDGQDETLMGLRIEMEQSAIPNMELKNAVRDAWSQYRLANKDGCLDYWARIVFGAPQLEHQEPEDEGGRQLLLQQYRRDIDRMLVNKTARAKAYLRTHERIMIADLHSGTSLDAARTRFKKIGKMYQLLNEEEENDEREVYSLPSGLRRVQPNGVDGDHQSNGINGLHQPNGVDGNQPSGVNGDHEPNEINGVD